MKLRKFMSVLLALVMAVTTMAVFAVGASAASIEDTAKTAVNGKSYSFTLTSPKGLSSGAAVDYKINATSAGNLVINLVSYSDEIKIIVYDKNANEVSLSSSKVTVGKIGNYCEWDKTLEKCSGKLTYKIKKGIYYVRIYRNAHWGSYLGTGKTGVVFTFPSDDDASSDSSSGVSITNFTLTMKVGDTIQLGADLSASTDDNITWKSSKTSVAKVSAAGKITAKAKGTAIITASIGSSSLTIKIKVTA